MNCDMAKISMGPRYFDLINKHLPGKPAMGAYCMGMVSALAMQDDLEPDDGLLELVSDCERVPKAYELYTLWATSRRRAARRQSARKTQLIQVPE